VRVWIAQIRELFLRGGGMNEEVDEWAWVLMTTEGEESKQKMVSHLRMRQHGKHECQITT
jgi:hypothetical protein